GEHGLCVAAVIHLVLLIDEFKNAIELVNESLHLSGYFLVVFADGESDWLAGTSGLEVQVHPGKEVLDVVAGGFDLESVENEDGVLRVTAVVKVEIRIAVEKVELRDIQLILSSVGFGGEDQTPR